MPIIPPLHSLVTVTSIAIFQKQSTTKTLNKYKNVFVNVLVDLPVVRPSALLNKIETCMDL